MKIAGKEISDDISVGNILSVIATLSSLLTFVWWLSSTQQAMTDAINNLTIRVSHVEQAQTDVAKNAVASAQAVNTVVDRNETRRDNSDAAMRAAIDRLTDRVNQLSDALAGRQHGDLFPLPHVASIGAPPWEP